MNDESVPVSPSPAPPPVTAPAPPPRRRSRAGLWIAIVVLLLVAGASMLVNLVLAAGLFFGGASAPSVEWHAGGKDEFPKFIETWSYGKGDAKVVRIAVEGVIMRGSDGGLFALPRDLVEHVLRQVRAAQNDEDVKGIILEVDSPGGGVTASDEIYMALRKFKESAPGRKVVVHMRDLAASGGYYISMAGDWLVAEPTTIVGSIGVIMQTLNMKGLGEKVGIKDVTIKSGRNKDLLNPFAEVDPAQVALLQKMIDATYEQFFGIVKGARGIDEAKLRELADGRVFDAKEALGLTLVDQIGYWDDVVAKTAELLGEEAVKIVRYEERFTLSEILLGVKQPEILPSVETLHRPRLMYLWHP